jgi:hypothetical protein
VIPKQGQTCTGYCPAYLYCDPTLFPTKCVPQLPQGSVCDPTQLQCQGVCDFSTKICGPPLAKACEGAGSADAGVGSTDGSSGSDGP